MAYSTREQNHGVVEYAMVLGHYSIGFFFDTLTVHDVYRRHSHHVQVMSPSILALLVNEKQNKQKTKVNKLQ